jgi:hypothetical protein
LHPVRVTLAFLVLALLLGLAGRAQAQSEGDIWGAPVNLSRSGAAEQPRIVAAPDGRLQVFWWDRFDGLMTARFTNGVRSSPMKAPILVTEEIENPGPDQEATVTLEAVSETPVIVSDGSARVHALWLAEPDEETGMQALMHSQMPIGSTSWSEPAAVAEAAVAFDVVQTASGGLTLAYLRTLHTDAEPAGVYVRRNLGAGGSWGAATVVYDTIYFRLLTAEEAYVRVADDGDETIHVVWEDPRLEEALYARSIDGAATWTEPTSLGDPDQRPARPRVVTLPDGGAMRLWEASAMSGCALYQQWLPATGTPTAIWSDPQRVLEGISQCPEGERFWSRDDDLFWLWGEGSGALTLAAWDAGQERWSEPQFFDFRFEDPETGRLMSLGDLHATLAGRRLAVVGYDPVSGEVWATLGEIDALELAFAPPSPWSEPVRLSREGTQAGWAAVALDAEGGVHVAWSEREAEGELGVAVLYAYRDGLAERWSRAVEVARGDSGGEIARQPALIVAGAAGQRLIHLVWSGGELGQILYSRAQIDQALSAQGWSPPQTLSDPGMPGGWPQIGVDGAGRLYVVYAVPLNEGRGIYLVRSEDGGLSWSDPQVLFDAQAAGWTMVDHPALAVARDGTLHVAWVHAPLPDTGPPQGIYYVRVGTDESSSMSAIGADSGEEGEAPFAMEPRELAAAGHDWPRLALAGDAIHLIYTAADGSVFQRRYGLSGETEGGRWDAPGQVAGLPSVSGPVGLAVDGGGTLHLVGVAKGGEGLLYATWDGERWSSPEAFALEPDGAQAAGAGLGGAAATLRQGGQLAVALSVMVADEEGETAPALYYVARVIPTVEGAALPTPPPLPSATPQLAESEPTPTLGVPTSTPDLLAVPAPAGPAVDPELLGGGLAALIVGGGLAMWLLWRKRR